MLELFTIVLTAVVSIVSPMPTSPQFVYIAKASSLNEAVLSVQNIPETTETGPALIIASAEKESGNTETDGKGISEGLNLNLVRGNGNLALIEGLIKRYSAQYSVSYEEMKRVMLCESSGKIDAVGDNGLAFGLYQFHENTFNLFAKDLGEKLEWKNPEHQIKLASWAFSRGKGYHWTCWKKIPARQTTSQMRFLTAINNLCNLNV